MRHASLMFFEMDQAIAEPSYVQESEPVVFEYVPQDNPMDGFYGETSEDYAAFILTRA